MINRHIKKLTLLLLSGACIFLSFSPVRNAGSNKLSYAFVTTTEHDKAFDEPGENGYVAITTNIVSFNCNLPGAVVEMQFFEHYKAEEKTENRERAFIGAPGITNAWIYNTYDEAFASRRDWLTKATAKHKRRIETFYVTCD